MTTSSPVPEDEELLASLRYLLCCETTNVPDCIVLRCCAVQRTVFRNPAESSAYYWHRVRWHGLALALERGGEHNLVSMTCVYGVPRPSDAAVKRLDALESRRMVLRGAMRDPTASWDSRIKAACDMLRSYGLLPTGRA